MVSKRINHIYLKLMENKSKKQNNILFKTKPEEAIKTNKLPKMVKLDKSVDINKLKIKFLKENDILKESNFKKNMQNNDTNRTVDYRYETLSQHYMNDQYGIKIFSMLIRMIDYAKLPNEVQLSYPIHTIFLKICRYLLFNEMEICLFSIYLDRLGWIDPNFEFDDNLFIVAILTKMNISPYSNVIVNSLYKEIKGLEQTFKHYVQLKLESLRFDILNTTVREMNERYELINKPFNAHCKEDFVDYNFCVDQILSMSLPYSDHKKGKKSNNFNISVVDSNFIPLKENNETYQNNASRSNDVFNLISNNPFNNKGENITSNITVPNFDYLTYKKENSLLTNNKSDLASLYGKYSSFIDKTKKASYNTVYDLPSNEMNSYYQYQSQNQFLTKGISNMNNIFPINSNIQSEAPQEGFPQNLDLNNYLNFKKAFVQEENLNKSDSYKIFKLSSNDRLHGNHTDLNNSKLHI